MSALTIGELFAGYGGLGMGVKAALGGEVRWVSDIDPGACKILAHRFPDVPNLGDITAIDWNDVEPVDILTGGFPCQDVSHAGRRAGLIRGETRTGLWAEMLRGIATLRPRLVVAENVRGLLSARADSDVEPCPWCMGDGDDQPPMRALGAVLGDLADVGYDAAWCGLRAADVGAAHGRFRVFILAWPADSASDTGWVQHGDHGAPADTQREGRGAARDTAPGEAAGGRAPAVAGRTGGVPAAVSLMPTPRATDGTKGGPNQRGSSGDLMLPSAVALLPTPTTQDGANTGGPSQYDRNSIPLNALVTLLPTPTSMDSHASGGGYNGQTNVTLTDATVRQPNRWGEYAPAIARWEAVLGRPAPAPTMTSSKGNQQLSPAFTEWMMGLPAEWITDVPGITRNEALRACGNGVVPLQAEAALRWLLPHVMEAAA